MPNWEAIQKEHEDGLSLRTLALKHGVSKSAIHNYVSGKKLSVVDTPGTDIGQSGQSVTTSSSPDNAAFAQRLIDLLKEFAEAPEGMTLKDHALLAQSLSQYNKIVVTSVTPQSATQGIDWSIFTQEEIDIVQPILAQAEERARVKAGENGIPQLRRTV